MATYMERPETGPDPEKGPLLSDVSAGFKENHKRRARRYRTTRQSLTEISTLLLGCLSLLILARQFDFPWPVPSPNHPDSPTPAFIKDGMKQCEIIQRPPPHHKNVDHHRTKSDRYVQGTKDTWLRNATVWTGNKGGEEIIYGADVYLSGGVIKYIGHPKNETMVGFKKDAEKVDLKGAWVTPGIVDMHSHMGVDASPGLRGMFLSVGSRL